MLYHMTLAKYYGPLFGHYTRPRFGHYIITAGVIGLGFAFLLAGRIEQIEFNKEVCYFIFF